MPLAAQLGTCLIAANLIAEFLLLPDPEKRSTGRGRLVSVGVHVALAYALVGWWDHWRLFLAIAGAYTILDFLRTRFGQENIPSFLLERATYAGAALILAVAFGHAPASPHASPLYGVARWGEAYLQAIVLVAGAVVTILTSGVLTARIVKPLRKQLSKSDDAGFIEGGLIIGRLERILIFVLVLSGNSAAIGFLVAAKSILRFGRVGEKEKDQDRELEDQGHEEKSQNPRMESEYIIIGTLASFTFATTASLLTVYLRDLPWIEASPWVMPP